MISTRYAFQRSKVMGRGLDFSTPPAYIRASTTELGAVGGRSRERTENKTEADGADGGRSMERKHLRNRAQVEVEGRGGRVAERSRDVEKGSGASQRAAWGPPPEKGASWRPQLGGVCRSQCGPERQLAEGSVSSSPSPIPSFALRERR